MNLHTAIDITSAAIIIFQAIAYRRLWHKHVETVAALWANTLGK